MPPDDPAIETPPADAPQYVWPAPPRGGLGAGIGLCGLFLFVEAAIAIPFVVAGALTGVWREPWFLFVLYAVVSIGASIVVARHADPGEVRRTAALRGCRPAQLALAVLLAPALMPPAVAVADLVSHSLAGPPALPFNRFAAQPPRFESFSRLFEAIAELPWPLAFFCGCLAPAVAEELLFRGVLGRRWVARYGLAGGVLLTTLVFALAHLNPSNVAATFLLGLALHIVYLATRSLVAPMALHAAYNGLVIAGNRAAADGWDVTGGSAAPWARLLLVLFAVAAGIVILRVLWQARTRWVLPDGAEWSPGYETAEMPPASLRAAPRSDAPGVDAMVAVGVSLVGLGFAFGLALDQPVEWKAYHYRLRGYALMEAGDTDGAIAAYDTALRLAPHDPDALADRGMARVYRRDFAGGRADLDRALAHHPNEPDWLIYRGDARWGLGDLDGALVDFDAALRLRPNHADTRTKQSRARLERGIQRHVRGDLSGAVQDYDQLLADDSNDLVALGNRGMALVQQREFARARDDLDRALTVHSDAAPWFGGRGDARWGLGDLDGALADYDAAVRLEPSDSYSRVQRGRVFLIREDAAAALSEFDAAIKAGADADTLRANRGRALFRLGRYAAAADELAAVVERWPGHQTAAYDLAWIRAACPDDSLRDGPQAVALARALCESTEWKAADPLAALAAGEAECGRFEEAVKHQEAAVRLSNPDGREFHERALVIYRGREPYRFGEDD